MPLEKPSRTFHAVCAYWLMSRDGSNAKAQEQHASMLANKTSALVRALPIRGLHLTPNHNASPRPLRTGVGGRQRSWNG